MLLFSDGPRDVVGPSWSLGARNRRPERRDLHRLTAAGEGCSITCGIILWGAQLFDLSRKELNLGGFRRRCENSHELPLICQKTMSLFPGCIVVEMRIFFRWGNIASEAATWSA